MRQPDFTNILDVLACKVPKRHTLFEFFLNEDLYKRLAGEEVCAIQDEFGYTRKMLYAYKNAGYDYFTLMPSSFRFKSGEVAHIKTKSLNDGALITDRQSYDNYKWANPEDFPLNQLDFAARELRDGMKAIAYGPGGVLENVIQLTGYDNLCYMTYEDPDLAEQIFQDVGSRLIKYYELVIDNPAVGAMISNDDWGFNRQTMLSPKDMRKYVFPWHKKIVAVGHNANKPVILHSCGNYDQIIDDVIDDMKYDARHSYEDNIKPIEEAYEELAGRIAVLGGIDLDFICTKTPKEVAQRSRNMLERAKSRGGYALGTGNSVPYYVPQENYMAMISVINE